MSRQPNKLLVFHLRGGPKGPRSIQANVSEDPSSSAFALWALTRKGAVGRHFDWHDLDGKNHGYKVVDKREEPDSIIVTCDHVREC